MRQPKAITMDEIFAEMEKLRKTAHGLVLTNDQKELLRRARAGQRNVSFPGIALLWERAGWGKVTPEFLRAQWEKLKRGDS